MPKKQVCRLNLWINPVFDERLAAEPDIALEVGDIHGPEEAIAAMLARAHVYHVSPARNELPVRWYVNDALLRACPNLLTVSAAGAGHDTVDVEACTRAGVAAASLTPPRTRPNLGIRGADEFRPPRSSKGRAVRSAARHRSPRGAPP